MASNDDPLAVRLLYTPHRPEPPQHAFLLLDELAVDEALYGGAAGGGKSDALLMAALRYVDVPGYAALLLRRTYQDLAKPGALMDRAKEWLAGTDAAWSERDFRFTFPSGAKLDFGYLKTAVDKYNYQSAEYQFIGFDEATQFRPDDYTYLFSRLRRPDIPDDAPEHVRRARSALAKVPLRMRAASNPGGRAHEFFKRRFITKEPDPDDPEDTPERAAGRVFIPARLDDNPHVDQASYERNLAMLTKVERARLRDGDWDADDGTLYFRPDDLAAVFELGDYYDGLAQAGDLPPPAKDDGSRAGGAILMAWDFGDSTHVGIGYPLEAGGLWVVAAEELEGLEPGAACDRGLELLGRELPDWPGKRKARHPLEHVREYRYDAAGLQSMRTVAKRSRLKRRALKVAAIPFGSYKRETALYLKHLAERAGDGHTTRVLAITAHRCRALAAQMRALVKDDKDRELWVKEDDHGPDMVVAMAAPIAQRWRHREPPAHRPPPKSLDALGRRQRV